MSFPNMIVTSESPIPPETLAAERHNLESRSRFANGDALSAIAYGLMATMILVLPFAGIRFAFGWNDPLSGLIGLGIIVVLSFRWAIHREWQRNAESRRALALVEQDLVNGVAQRVTVENICRAWEVVDVEDFGPAYVLETREQEYIQIMSQDLPSPELNPDGNEHVSLSRLELTRLPLSGELCEGMTAAGPSVEVIGFVSIEDLGPFRTDGDELAQYAVLDRRIVEFLEGKDVTAHSEP